MMRTGHTLPKDFVSARVGCSIRHQWRLRIRFSFLKFILNLTDTYRAVKREMSIRLLSILYRGRARRGRKKKGKLKRIGKKGKGLETNNLKN